MTATIMPIDQAQMRKVSEHNEDVCEAVKVMSRKLASVDHKNYEEIRVLSKEWMNNVYELKKSLAQQQLLSTAMRENARIEDEEGIESFRDRYRFLVDKLKDDVRAYFYDLREFVDLPQDFTLPKTWDHFNLDMEMDLEQIPSTVANSHVSAGLDALVHLLNYRDAIVALLLNGLLFQKAVFDWDVKAQHEYADGPMVQMFETIVDYISKTETIPAKYVSEIPRAFQDGSFTLVKRGNVSGGLRGKLSPVQSRLRVLLREMQGLDHGLRNLTFDQSVSILDQNRSTGKNIAVTELRGEVIKWYNKCQILEKDLRRGKASRSDVQEVEQLTAKCEGKEAYTKKLNSSYLKLEGEVQTLRMDIMNLRRGRDELEARNQKSTKETVPLLERMGLLLRKARDCVNTLTADAEVLSLLFRKQVEENKKSASEHCEHTQELCGLQEDLKQARSEIQRKEAELQKKETLYLRTMAARKAIHESFLHDKAKITAAEDNMRRREFEWEEMLKVLNGRDSEINHLKEYLRRTSQRIDELEQQCKMCWRMLAEVVRKSPEAQF